MTIAQLREFIDGKPDDMIVRLVIPNACGDFDNYPVRSGHICGALLCFSAIHAEDMFEQTNRPVWDFKNKCSVA